MRPWRRTVRTRAWAEWGDRWTQPRNRRNRGWGRVAPSSLTWVSLRFCVCKVSSPGGLVPRAGKKGECWTFLDWRLNSENDSPVHGQPARFGHTGRKLISLGGAGLDWEAFYISISFLVVETGSAHLRRVNHCRSVRISFISSEAKHEPPYVTEERQWGTNRNWNFIIIICP